MRKLIAIIFCMLVIVPTSYASDDNADLRKYVENLIQEGNELVNDKSLSSIQKYKGSSNLIRNNLYIDWMAKYVLGRNRRTLSDAKIAQFTKVYSKFVVNSYADLTSHYSGKKAILNSIRKINDDMYIASLEISSTPGSGKPPIKIDYLVHYFANNAEHPYKIGDIITEGISLLNSQQSEFNSVISSQGIDALISALSQKVKNKKSEHKDIDLTHNK